MSKPTKKVGGRRAGGLARSVAMTPEERSASARKAACARWAGSQRSLQPLQQSGLVEISVKVGALVIYLGGNYYSSQGSLTNGERGMVVRVVAPERRSSLSEDQDTDGHAVVQWTFRRSLIWPDGEGLVWQAADRAAPACE